MKATRENRMFKQNSPIYYLALIVFFFSIYFIGTIRIEGIPVKADLFISLSFLLFFIITGMKLKRNVIRMSILFSIFLLYFCLHLMFYNTQNKSLIFKDEIFMLLIIYAIITYVFLAEVTEKVDKVFIQKAINGFIIFSFVLAIAQSLNLLNINSILRSYYNFLSLNVSTGLVQVENIEDRVFGTIGSKVTFALAIYLLARLTILLGSKKIYLLPTFCIILLSGARGVLGTFLLMEAVFLIYEQKLSIKRSIILILSLAFFVWIAYLAYENVKLFHNTLDRLTDGTIFEGRSFTYRHSMYGELFSSDATTIMFGGKSVSQFPRYVDSEYVMRIFQFGVIGFFLLYLPYFYFTLKYRNIYATFLIVVLLIRSITSSGITNVTALPYILLFMAVSQRLVFDKKPQKNKALSKQ